MQTSSKITDQEEWLKILTKGMVTIPKSWRDELGIKEGEMVRAKKTATKIIIEQVEKKVPYRIYSRKELQQFLKDDKLPKKLADKAASFWKDVK